MDDPSRDSLEALGDEDPNRNETAEPHRILVVDDEAPVCKMLTIALSEAGFNVASAADANEALEILTTLCPDLAIIDINLPGVSGMELCRQLSGSFAIEVLLITGYDDSYSYEDAAQAGACDFLTKPIRIQELVLRVERAMAARRIRIERDHTVDELRRLSVTDGLTGLFNSRHFAEKLKGELLRSGRYGHNICLLLLDLDHFKEINDCHGHLEGDRALLLIGDVIRETIRDSDSAYRYGGDEFAVILPETDEEAARRVAERLRQAIACKCSTPDPSGGLKVTASVGIALWRPGEDPDAFLHRADMAMYKAKQCGRNRIEMATKPADENE